MNYHKVFRTPEIAELPKFGPEYKTRIVFKVNSLPPRNWANIFHITYGENQLKGSHFPSLFLNVHSFMRTILPIENNSVYELDFNETIKVGESYDMTLQQNQMENGKFLFEALLRCTSHAKGRQKNVFPLLHCPCVCVKKGCK